MADKVNLVNTADPVKVCQNLAKLISEKEGVEIKLKNLKINKPANKN